ncbi:hypothetical protein [Rhodopila sp.]|uniref:hypothetical protein n=1 Tax=Rhodopila sp. TaxID=2480087 RepID=UPI003D0A3CAD
MTRYYFHGDLVEAGGFYCASCDAKVDGAEHFAAGACADPQRQKARLKATKKEYAVLKKQGYFRPDDAENVLTGRVAGRRRDRSEAW